MMASPASTINSDMDDPLKAHRLNDGIVNDRDRSSGARTPNLLQQTFQQYHHGRRNARLNSKRPRS
jgi:hypothetical protein